MPAPVLQFKRGNAGVAGTVPALRPGEPAISLNNFDFFIGIDTSVANNKFFGSHRYWGREDGSTSLKLKLVDKDGTNGIHLKSPNTLSGIGTYTLPDTSTIQNGYFLKVATDGTLSWDTVGGTNGTFTNATLSGITTVSGTFFDVNAQADFSGITTFSNTTDSTNKDNGAVVIEGGVGIEKSVNIGGNIYVTGLSTFNGLVVTNNNLDVQAHAEIQELQVVGFATVSQTLDVDGLLRADGQAIIAGITTFNDTTNSGDYNSGSVVINGGVGIEKDVNIHGNLNVDGNVTIGGTTVTLKGEDVYIQNKDIILGFTTAISPNDDTANHGGVAIASTVGTPLASFAASGINTLPDTYKQLMWFKQGTLGFGTDAFAFNYGLAIGTTTMANGVRLAVGSGITMSDNSISATNGYFTNISVGSVTGTISTATRANTVDTVTASNTNATYHLTFVDSHNGSATAETVYTDDGIYYNPGTNTFTTQYGYFTGNVTVDGTITGTATTATRATTVDTTGTSTNADYYVTFVDTLAGQTGETVRVGTGLSVNPSTGDAKVAGSLSVGNINAVNAYIKAGGGSNALYLYSNGDVSFQAKAIVNEIRSSSNASTLITLSDLDATFARDVKVTGITTTGTLKLNGTSGIGITGISTSTTLAENSNSYLPTQAAVKAYVDAVDVTLGLNADTGGPSTVSTSQTLTISGTANEVNTSVSGQTVTVGLPNSVTVTTALTTPTVKATNLQANDGTTSITISDGTGNVGIASNLTITGDLYVNGNTTQVNVSTLTVEDTLVELGMVNGSAPGSDLNKDLGLLLNYYTSSAKKAAMFWDDSASRIVFADDVTESSGVITVASNAYASIEIEGLWVNDCAGQSQVISCTGSERFLENITVDAGTF